MISIIDMPQQYSSDSVNFLFLVIASLMIKPGWNRSYPFHVILHMGYKIITKIVMHMHSINIKEQSKETKTSGCTVSCIFSLLLCEFLSVVGH